MIHLNEKRQKKNSLVPSRLDCLLFKLKKLSSLYEYVYKSPNVYVSINIIWGKYLEGYVNPKNVKTCICNG